MQVIRRASTSLTSKRMIIFLVAYGGLVLLYGYYHRNTNRVR
jgi:hypothetical protein